MQINRLFEIIYILLENKIVTSAELARRFEVSPRTIYRDVEALSLAGIPIYMSKGKGGGISLLPEFILDKSVLTKQEKIDILSSLRALSAVSFSKNEAALSKLGSMLGEKNTDWIEVDFSSWGSGETEAEYFRKAKNAIIEKRVITFLYASGKAESLSREVMPLKLVFKGAAWYIYGFCSLRKDFRFFKLRRISDISVSDEHFDMTAPQNILHEQTTDFSTYIKAVFLIKKEMAFRVYDEINDFKRDINGDFICELLLPDISIICTYAASFGEYCTIIYPEPAVNEMKKRLEKSLKNYS